MTDAQTAERITTWIVDELRNRGVDFLSETNAYEVILESVSALTTSRQAADERLAALEAERDKAIEMIDSNAPDLLGAVTELLNEGQAYALKTEGEIIPRMAAAEAQLTEVRKAALEEAAQWLDQEANAHTETARTDASTEPDLSERAAQLAIARRFMDAAQAIRSLKSDG